MHTLFALAAVFSSASAFSPSHVTAPWSVAARTTPIIRRHSQPAAVVDDVSSTEEFNAALASAGDQLLVVDYSTSWCGPCKIIAPKFDEFSEKYSNVKFVKVPHAPFTAMAKS